MYISVKYKGGIFMSWAKKFKLNLRPILSWTIKSVSMIFSILTIVLSFISWEDMHINELYQIILILISVPIFAFIVSSLVIVSSLKKKRLWANGRNKVLAFYGDLLKIAKNSEKKIVVIPVNDTFETIVDDDLDTPKPLVALKTIHGQWIKYMESCDYNSDTLYTEIKKNLNERGYSPVIVYSRKKRERGKLDSYKVGTIATITQGNTTFYLLAITQFDDNNVAKSSRKIVRDCIDDLLSFYDKNGQGYPIYIPLFGSGRARADLNQQQSFNIMKTSVLTNEKMIHGVVNLVVYKNDKDKVSIYK